MKSGNLNFLEPSGPLQACNGTALPLPSDVKEKISLQKISTTIWKDNITMDNIKTVCYDVLESLASADQVIGSCDHINENRAVVERHTTRCRP
jgi:hypothetical protein